MLCRVEMPTNEQTFGRFYRWRLLNLGGVGGALMLVYLPFFILAIVVYFWLAGMAIGVGVVVMALACAYSLYLLYGRPGVEFRKRPGAAMETETYIFTENGFTRSVRSEESAGVENNSGQYSTLFRVIETKKDFYLFFSPTRAYIVDKAYFTKGTPEELSAFLKEKVPNLYNNKKR